MTGAEVLPATAWEQAAIIGIFIVFVGILLAWFSKQSDKWQGFMLEIDEKWRAFNKEQREENNACMTDVNSGLRNLTKVTEGLVQEVREMRTESREITLALATHDNQAKDILRIVESMPKSRAKKPAE